MATVLAGDEDSFWHFSLHTPPRPPIEDTATTICSGKQAVRVFERLWSRRAAHSGDLPPEAFLDSVRAGVDEILEGYNQNENNDLGY